MCNVKKMLLILLHWEQIKLYDKTVCVLPFQYNPGRILGCEARFCEKNKFPKKFIEFTQAKLSYAKDAKVSLSLIVFCASLLSGQVKTEFHICCRSC